MSVTLLAAAAVATPAPLGAAHAAAAATPAAGTLPANAATLSPQLLQQLNAQYTHKSALAQNVPWLAHIIAGLFLLFAIALIVLLAFQTTKQEGLSGTIGGRVEAAYRPRLGFDQQLARLTTFVAVGFVFFALCTSLAGF